MEPQTGKQSGDSMLEYENDKSPAANRFGALRNRAVLSGAEKLAYSSLVSASWCRGSAMLLWYALRSEHARKMAVLLKCCSLGEHAPGFDSLGRGWRERKGDQGELMRSGGVSTSGVGERHARAQSAFNAAMGENRAKAACTMVIIGEGLDLP